MATKQVLGKVLIVMRGEYDNEETYERLDVVTYNGSSYIAKKETIGNLPTDNSFWSILAKKGDSYEINKDDLEKVKGEVANIIKPDLQKTIQNILGSITSGTPLVVSSVDEMTDTTRIYVNITDGNWYYHDGSNWQIGGLYLSNGQSTYQLYAINKFDPYYNGIIPLYNHLNNSSAESGKYYDKTSGVIQKKSANGYTTFDKFIVRANKTYCIYENGNPAGNIARAFTILTDINGNIIGNPSGDNIHEFTTTHDGYLYLTLISNESSDFSNCVITYKDYNPSSYTEYNIPYNFLINNKDFEEMYDAYKNLNTDAIIKYNEIKVGINEAYTKIKDAISSITDATNLNRYNIIIEDGTYNENNINLPDYVNLVGKSGIKENCIINGSLPASATDNAMSGTSTLNMNYNNEIHNITIIAKNMRYPVHDETNGKFKNFTQLVNNCLIEHQGNDEVIQYRIDNDLPAGNPWSSPHAWGMGASSGCKLTIKNSILKSVEDAFYVHGASNFEKPYLITIEDSELISTKLINSVYVDNTTPQISGNTLLIKNCLLNSRYAIIENSQYQYKTIISGSEVVPVYQRPGHVNDINGYPLFTNNTKIMIADENLTKGTFVKSKDGIHVAHADSTTPLNEIIGYTIGNVNQNDNVIINSKYMQPSSQTWPETSIESGNKMSLDSNGKIKISTSDDDIIIGISQDRWYKLYI